MKYIFSGWCLVELCVSGGCICGMVVCVRSRVCVRNGIACVGVTVIMSVLSSQVRSTVVSPVVSLA